MPVANKKYFYISSLAKGLKVLELLVDKQELSVSEVAKALGFNRASSHRFLATLMDLGYVEKSTDNRYRLAFKVMEMGLMMANRIEVRQVARSYMQKLSASFNETVNLGYFDGRDILHIDKIDSREILRIDSPLGSRAPAYCTALGKVLLAFLPPEELNTFLAGVKLKPHGPNTITSRKKLLEELNVIREQHVAVDDEELSAGLRCVASPIFDHTGRANYAISISGPLVRHTFERIAQIQISVREVCGEISEKLGSVSFTYPEKKVQPILIK
jgi:DNA-binding IclR family transcriptional regulator